MVPACHSVLSLLSRLSASFVCLRIIREYQRISENISISPGLITSPHLHTTLAPPSSQSNYNRYFVFRRKIVESEHGSQLVISLAESVDSGEYSCQVSALDKSVLTHHVNVRGEN